VPRAGSVDERAVDAIIREALREEQKEPVLSSELPDQRTVARLGVITLEDSSGERVKLGSLWESSPAALIFLRHYG